MQSIRIYEMPTCKMVSSGVGMFGEGNFCIFEEWFSSLERGLFPKDFLYWAGEGFVWLYLFEEGMEVPPGLEVIEFQGGNGYRPEDGQGTYECGNRPVPGGKWV